MSFFRRYHLWIVVTVAVLMAAVYASFPSVVAAQGDTFGLNQVNNTVQLAGGDLRVTIARIIRAILSVLGVIALAIVLYGGFVYMTAGGNEDKVAQAKKILINGVIGLAIILTSWSITQFVLSKLSEATGSGTVGVNDGGGGNGGPCDSGSSDYNPAQCTNFCTFHPEYSTCQELAFFVKSITPSTPGNDNVTGMNNVKVRLLFSHPLAADTRASEVVQVKRRGVDLVPMSGEVVENNRVIEMVKADGSVWEPDEYTVEVAREIRDTNGKALDANYSNAGINYPAKTSFTVDRVFTDASQPNFDPLTINGVGGNDASLTIGTNYTFVAVVRDRGQNPPYGGTGLARLVITENGSNKVVVNTYGAPVVKIGSSPDYGFSYKNVIDAANFAPLKKYTATVTAWDIDNNSRSASLTFSVYGKHCGNGVKDGDETDTDVGGSCGKGSGENCTSNADCGTGFKCVENKCTAYPKIQNVDPMDGAETNWITVFGSSFGTLPGKVEFAGSNNTWVMANVVVCGAESAWHPTWVVVEVPAGILDKSAIRLTTAGETPLSDATNDEYGPKPAGDGLFTKNSIKRPGLCKVGVTNDAEIGDKKFKVFKGETKGVPQTPVTVAGTGFGTNSANNTIMFGGVNVSALSWSERAIDTKVPANLQPGNVGVNVTVGGQTSNGVAFTVLSDLAGSGGPQISAIDPNSATPKSFITIKGSGFGSAVGQVYLADTALHAVGCDAASPDGTCRSLNVNNLPGACGTTWTDTQIIAEIPDATPPAIYHLALKNSQGTKTDGQAIFTVKTGAPLPSLCRVDPNIGPAPLPKDSQGVRLYGVNFSDAPIVYYWRKDAKADDISTWLHSDVDLFEGKSPVTQITDTQIQSLFPVTAQGLTIENPGTIKIKSKTGAVSNGVNYTVKDCRQTGALAGYQCCIQGADAGLYKPNGFQCAGESREAGYAWRFTTGLIPDLPRVREECNEVDWNKPGAAVSFPSPTPWEKTNRGKMACVNASVAVHFNLPMDPKTLVAGNVQLLECVDNNGQPDCSAAKEEKNLTLGIQSGVDTVWIIRDNKKGDLTKNKWYRVILKDKIQSQQFKVLLGQNQAQNYPLQKTRPCGAGTAYCFDFKTGDGVCALSSAGILPPENNVGYLGMLQDPSYPFETLVNPFAPTHPLHYYLWGKSNQECSVLNPDGLGWVWKSQQPTKATATVAPGVEAGMTYKDSRATVSALEQTAPDKAIIQATMAVAPNSAPEFNVLKTYGISADPTAPLPAGGYTLDTAKVPLLNFDKPFTLDFAFKNNDQNLGSQNNTVKKLLIKNGSYGFWYYSGVGANNLGLCLGKMDGAVQGAKIACAVEPPVLGKLYHYVITWDGTTVQWYGESGKLLASADLPSFPQSSNPVVIPNLLSNGFQHGWSKFSMSPGALSAGGVADLFAGKVGGSTYTATSSLVIDLLDPAIVDFGPGCSESCVNADIWATFNRQMATATFALSGAWTIKECQDVAGSAVCDEATASNITDHYQIDQENTSPWHLHLTLKPGAQLLKAKTYYKVTFGSSIQALDKLTPPQLGKHLVDFPWTFRTQDNPAPCAPSKVNVVPHPFTATAVGQKTLYTAQPLSSPNACSKFGQPVNKWAYGYKWSTDNAAVATTTNYTTGYGIKPYCTLTCLLAGSTTNNTSTPLCGNGTLDIGEDCDVASSDYDGCALNCLYNEAKKKQLGITGSPSVDTFDAKKTGAAYCGDGILQKGEACDMKLDPAGCTAQCLHKGTTLTKFWCKTHSADSDAATIACAKAISVCGNKLIEDGEACEPGVNGATDKTCNPKYCILEKVCGTSSEQCKAGTAGCTAKCTFAGSSPLYKQSSLCGDGKVGTGEVAACENTESGQTLAAGPTQIVEAVGQGVSASGTMYQETKINASILTTTTIKGSGAYRLQCGYQEFTVTANGLFNDCPQNAGDPPGNDYGVAQNSCCTLRPKRLTEYPADGAGLSDAPVCRNTYLEVTFPRRMKLDSIKDNVLLVRGYTTGTTCASGTIDYTAQVNKFFSHSPPADGEQISFWKKLWQQITAFLVRLFDVDQVLATKFENSVLASGVKLWCAGEVKVTPDIAYSGAEYMATSTVPLFLDQPLASGAIYGVFLRGGKNGITDSLGVPIGSPDVHKHSPHDIWFFRTGEEICKVDHVTVDPESHTYKKPDTGHTFIAKSVSTNQNQLIVPTAAYDWEWRWKPVGNPVFDIPDVKTTVNTISSNDVQGHINGVVQATITKDTTDTNNQLNKVFSAHFDLTAFFCEYPWPAPPDFPYQDDKYNYRFGYCSDAGKAGTVADDLPYLQDAIVYTPGTNNQTLTPDTLKKMLFFNDENEDVIGVQIFQNSSVSSTEGKSITDWYQEKFQSLGNMKPATVGGYETLTDGNNVYVNALNVDNGVVFSNVYQFSINANAQANTREVFKKILASVVFNTNLTDYGYCLAAGAPLSIRTASDQIVDTACTSDLQCTTAAGTAVAGTNGVCSNVKTKFFRDWTRLHDIQLAQDKLDAFYATADKIIDFKGSLKSGTFIPGYTVSRWPSWGTLGGLVGGLPVDPINDWMGCSSTDGQTCWNAASTTFSCPKVSRVYEYEFVSSTMNYVFHAPLEYFLTSDELLTEYVDVSHFSDSPWPACVGNASVSPFNALCGDGVVGPTEQCDPPGAKKAESVSNGLVTKVYNCTNSCVWDVQNPEIISGLAKCGNNIVEGSEKCDDGKDNGTYGHCSAQCNKVADTYCGDGVVTKPEEFCEKIPDILVSLDLSGNGVVKRVLVPYGTLPKVQENISRLCAEDKNSIWCALTLGALDSQIQKVGSGNKYCNGVSSKKLACFGDTDCQAPNDLTKIWNGDTATLDTYASTQVGSYGTCVAREGTHGTPYNLNKNLSCAWNCKGFGGYCGDGKVQTDSGEECDDTNSANGDGCSMFCTIERGLLCKQAQPEFTVNKDGSNASTTISLYKSGQPIAECTNGTTARDLCVAYGLTCNSIEAKFSTLKPAIKKCNEYDSGDPTAWGDTSFADIIKNTVPTVSGLSAVCNGAYVPPTPPAAPAGQCGNGKKDEGEFCDQGNLNGIACVPEYGKPCTYCANDCKKGLKVDAANYCGNGKIDPGSPEVCEVINGEIKTPTISQGVKDYSNLETKSCQTISGQKGSYQCSSDCRTLTNNCVMCGAVQNNTLPAGTPLAPIPRLSVVNPMIGSGAGWPFKSYGEGFLVSTYLNAETWLGYSKISDYIKSTASSQTKLPSTQYKNLWVNDNETPILDKGLQSSLLCSSDYKLFFNYKNIVDFNSSTVKGSWITTGGDSGFKAYYEKYKDIDHGIGDLFEYPVNGEVGQIDQEVLYSPAVPPEYFRVVVRWTEAEHTTGAEFVGGLYNANDAKLVDYFDYDLNQQLCTQMATSSVGGDDYFLPVASANDKCAKKAPGVWVHPSTGGQKIFTQAFTLNSDEWWYTEGTGNNTVLHNYPVSFFVKALSASITEFVNKNVTVEVYEPHSNQVGLYSVYKPTKTFTIQAAGGTSSNSLAQFWHVFNFEYNENNKKYEIKPVNSIETNLCQVKDNMPNVAPCSP